MRLSAQARNPFFLSYPGFRARSQGLAPRNDELVSSLSKLSGLLSRDVWVYVTEIPARQMAEYGHVLPEPGDEQMWLDGLPAEDRAYMQGVG